MQFTLPGPEIVPNAHDAQPTTGVVKDVVFENVPAAQYAQPVPPKYEPATQYVIDRSDAGGTFNETVLPFPSAPAQNTAHLKSQHINTHARQGQECVPNVLSPKHRSPDDAAMIAHTVALPAETAVTFAIVSVTGASTSAVAPCPH